ncbi:MAG TPA: nuclear transport factor 2 family protein [Solirubrobacterales bacterium]
MSELARAVDRGQLSEWLDGYERAWREPGTDALVDLFTEDATYSTAPYESQHRGLAAIARMWEAERSGPGEDFSMPSEVVAVEGDTGVVRIEVLYGAPEEKRERLHRQRSEYRDLWIVRLNEEGLCFHFEEWPFWPPDQKVAPAAGAE